MSRLLSRLVVIVALLQPTMLLCAKPASAAWTLVAHAENGNSDGVTGPFKAPTGVGTVNCTGADLYTVAMSWYSSAADPPASVLADVSGNTYIELAHQSAAGDTSNRLTWFYKVAPTVSASEQWTVTFDAGTGGPQFVGLTAACFSGSSATPTITHVEDGTTTSTPSAGSIGTAGDLVVTAVSDYTVTVSGINSSFQITDQSNYTVGNNIGIAMAWPNLSGGVAGAVNPVWTLSGSPGASVVQALSFTGTGGGGGGTSPPPCTLRLLGVGCNVP